jgi:uncharacterized membrane protein
VPRRSFEPRTGRGVAVQAAIIVVASVAMLSAAFIQKDRCYERYADPSVGHLGCRTDLANIYLRRGFVDGHPPYVGGDGRIDRLPGAANVGDLEYPPGTGLLIVAGMAEGRSARGFVRVEAVFFAAFAALTIAALWSSLSHRWRILLVVLTPITFQYSYFSWDWPAVALMCVGVIAAARERFAWSGLALGLGAMMKVFPGVLIPVALWAAWRRKRLAGACTVLVTSLGSIVLMCAPVALLDREAFVGIWAFHRERRTHQDSLPSLIYRQITGAEWRDVPPLDLQILAASLAGFLFIMGWVWRRHRAGVPVAAVNVAGATLCVWMLFAKVYSPQYALWLLPFFAMIRLPVWSWIGYVALDAVFFPLVRPGVGPVEGIQHVFDLLIVSRSLWFVVLAWLMLRRPSAIGTSSVRMAAHAAT